MNENYVSGINENEIIVLSINIEEYALKLNEKFEELTSLVDDLKFPFYSKAGRIFKNRYDQLSSNYKIAIKNILSYSDDLKKVKSSYKAFEKETSQSFGKDRVFKEIESLKDKI